MEFRALGKVPALKFALPEEIRREVVETLKARHSLRNFFGAILTKARRHKATVFPDTQREVTDLYKIRDALRNLCGMIMTINDHSGNTFKPFCRAHERIKPEIARRFAALRTLPVSDGEIALALNSLVRLRDFFLSAEKHIIVLEAAAVDGGVSARFKTCASRFERSKGREWFKNIMAEVQTDRFRQIFILPPSGTLDAGPRFDTRTTNRGEEDCSICQDTLETAIMTESCCKKPFHPDCLLKWMLVNCDNKTTACPLCRERLGIQWFAELLEMRTQKVGSL